MAKVTEANSSNNRGLVFQGRLPLAWRSIDALPSAAELEEQASTNLETLRILSLMDTPLGEAGDEKPDAKAQDIARLDFKLNLLLELLEQLLIQQRIIPETRPLTLTPNSLSWQDGEKLAVPSLLIELYCSMKYPRPLGLHGRVKEALAQSAGWQIEVTLQALSEFLQEALESFIFVQHRRAIAQSRR